MFYSEGSSQSSPIKGELFIQQNIHFLLSIFSFRFLLEIINSFDIKEEIISIEHHLKLFNPVFQAGIIPYSGC